MTANLFGHLLALALAAMYADTALAQEAFTLRLHNNSDSRIVLETRKIAEASECTAGPGVDRTTLDARATADVLCGAEKESAAYCLRSRKESESARPWIKIACKGHRAAAPLEMNLLGR